jgi:hypothetical protein
MNKYIYLVHITESDKPEHYFGVTNCLERCISNHRVGQVVCTWSVDSYSHIHKANSMHNPQDFCPLCNPNIQ